MMSVSNQIFTRDSGNIWAHFHFISTFGPALTSDVDENSCPWTGYFRLLHTQKLLQETLQEFLQVFEFSETIPF